MRLHRTNRALAAVLREPSQALLMGLVDRAIPSAGARFREWHYQRRELRVIVEDPDPDPIAYVRALEAEPLFEQVAGGAGPWRRPDRDHAAGAGVNALARALRPVAAELAANARLRWGVWLIAGILLFWCILVQSDRVAAVHGEYAAEAGHLARARSLLERQDWRERLEAERAAHRTLGAVLWEAETEGLAQAKLQGALGEAVEGLALREPRISSGVSQPVPRPAGGMAGPDPVRRRLSARRRAAGAPRPGHVSEEVGRRPPGPGAGAIGGVPASP